MTDKINFNEEQQELARERRVRYEKIVSAMDTLRTICHGDNKAAGWWTDIKTGKNLTFNYQQRMVDGTLTIEQMFTAVNKVGLIHTEVSEALEAFRKNLMDDKIPDFTGFETEIIDTIVRCFDILGGLNLRGSYCMFEKLEFNRSRNDHKPEERKKKGGKLF